MISTAMAEPSSRVLHHLDSDSDDLFDELEREVESSSTLAGLREQRLEQLQREFDMARAMKESQHGTYVEIKDEKDVLKLTTSVAKCVVHFGHPEFRRCKIVDGHLETLAKKHFKTRFVKVNVENVPFLVERLKVQVLPCIIFFVDSISKDRLIGFEELGNTDNFTTAMLEKRLLKAGVIDPPTTEHAGSGAGQQRSIFRYNDTRYGGGEEDDESEDD